MLPLKTGGRSSAREGRRHLVNPATPAMEADPKGGNSLRLQSLGKETQNDVSFHTWWKEGMGCRLSPSCSSAPSAQERLEAIRCGVAAKEARARSRCPPSLNAEFRGAKRRTLAWSDTTQVIGPAMPCRAMGPPMWIGRLAGRIAPPCSPLAAACPAACPLRTRSSVEWRSEPRSGPLSRVAEAPVLYA